MLQTRNKIRCLDVDVTGVMEAYSVRIDHGFNEKGRQIKTFCHFVGLTELISKTAANTHKWL